jgi:hypothetical protein
MGAKKLPPKRKTKKAIEAFYLNKTSSGRYEKPKLPC